MADELRVVCPAGEQLHDACRCKIEHATITDRENPTSLRGFCCGNYQACPTWRTARDAENEQKLRAENERLARVTGV